MHNRHSIFMCKIGLLNKANLRKGAFMGDRHIFNKDTDSEMLAMDIVTFLQKWGTLRFYELYKVVGKVISYRRH